MATREQEDRFAELVSKRDKVNAKLVPLKEELAQANLAVIEAQKAADQLAIRINDIRGGKEWLDTKKEIAQLAMLGAGRAYRPSSNFVKGAASLWSRILSRFR